MSTLDQLRPRLSSVLLRRSGGELQVGLGPAAVLLADPADHWHQLLSGCDGADSLATLVWRSPLPDEDVRECLAALLERGLLDAAAEPRRGPTLRARLVGAGAIAAALARTLPGLGFSSVYVHDDAAPDAELYPHTKARHQSEALCRVLDARCFRPVRHWSKPSGVEIAVTVVCSPTIEVDRGLTDDLVRADQPHLVIRPLPTGAVVGPLVIPGRTSCLRCCDLQQRDLDPEWPLLLRQLSRRALAVDPVTRSWAVALAAVQLRGFLDDRRVEVESGTLELTATESRQLWRPWPPHPECSCQW